MLGGTSMLSKSPTATQRPSTCSSRPSSMSMEIICSTNKGCLLPGRDVVANLQRRGGLPEELADQAVTRCVVERLEPDDGAALGLLTPVRAALEQVGPLRQTTRIGTSSV